MDTMHNKFSAELDALMKAKEKEIISSWKDLAHIVSRLKISFNKKKMIDYIIFMPKLMHCEFKMQ